MTSRQAKMSMAAFERIPARKTFRRLQVRWVEALARGCCRRVAASHPPEGGCVEEHRQGRRDHCHRTSQVGCDGKNLEPAPGEGLCGQGGAKTCCITASACTASGGGAPPPSTLLLQLLAGHSLYLEGNASLFCMCLSCHCAALHKAPRIRHRRHATAAQSHRIVISYGHMQSRIVIVGWHGMRHPGVLHRPAQQGLHAAFVHFMCDGLLSQCMPQSEKLCNYTIRPLLHQSLFTLLVTTDRKPPFELSFPLIHCSLEITGCCAKLSTRNIASDGFDVKYLRGSPSPRDVTAEATLRNYSLPLCLVGP